MSIAVMTRVWSESKAEHGSLLLLLAIADHADDDGYAYPSLPKLAAKARLSETQTREGLRQLVKAGELLVEAGKGPNGRNLYRVLTGSRPAARTPSPPETEGYGNRGVRNPQGTETEGEGCGFRGARGAVSAPPPTTPYKDEPSGGTVSEPSGAVSGETSDAPLPARSVADESRKPARPAANRGTRLPDDWQPTDALIGWAGRECPALSPVALAKETAKFRDYWRAQPGAKGLKADWEATWRTWVRRADEAAPNPRASPPPPAAPPPARPARPTAEEARANVDRTFRKLVTEGDGFDD